MISKKHRMPLIIGTLVLSLATTLAVKKIKHRPTLPGSAHPSAPSQDSVKVLHVSPEILRDYSLVTTQLAEVSPTEEILLPGRVQKDLTQTAMVTARAPGRVTKILVKETDDVELGQVLAILQSTEVAQAQSAHLRTLLRFGLARRQRARSDDLFRHQIVSAKDHELAVMEFQSVKSELEASRTQLEHLNLSKVDIRQLEKKGTHSGELKIRSPIAGTVLERKAVLGQSVAAEDALFTVGNLDQVWIVLDVYEKDISVMKEGMPVEVLIPASEGAPEILKAKVARIAQEFDSATRSAKVWVEVKNEEQELKFGQAVSARIQGIQHPDLDHQIQALPLEAVHKIEGDSILFVKVGDTDFEARKVETGWTSDRWVEIKSGVKTGETVISRGSFILKSEFLKN